MAMKGAPFGDDRLVAGGPGEGEDGPIRFRLGDVVAYAYRLIAERRPRGRDLYLELDRAFGGLAGGIALAALIREGRVAVTLERSRDGRLHRRFAPTNPPATLPTSP